MPPHVRGGPNGLETLPLRVHVTGQLLWTEGTLRQIVEQMMYPNVTSWVTLIY